jgi:hypothetical protein
MIIGVDFDGTCVKHAYPHVGEDIGAVPVLKELVANGHDLILWTMRSGDSLEAAIDWFKTNEIELYASQRNPTQDQWTSSPKAYCQIYIDDAALGCPLVNDHVDWIKVRKWLVEKRVL